MNSSTLKHSSPFWVLLLVWALVPLFAQSDKKLTDCQTSQATALQLREQNAELRRNVVLLQLQLEQLRGPSEQQAVEAEWKALEKDAGCTLDRQTKACKPDKEKK